jgi:bifunctional DNA-binding transcriptional regulator/antitoxin component of YhaV-PrlF toxin-antitoxin module
MKTTLTIDDDGILTFPPELLEVTGWKEGDMLEWIDRGDGSFELRKNDES